MHAFVTYNCSVMFERSARDVVREMAEAGDDVVSPASRSRLGKISSRVILCSRGEVGSEFVALRSVVSLLWKCVKADWK